MNLKPLLTILIIHFTALAFVSAALAADHPYVGSYFVKNDAVLPTYRVYMTTTYRDTTDPSVIGSGNDLLSVLSVAGAGSTGTCSGHIYQAFTALYQNGSFRPMYEVWYDDGDRPETHYDFSSYSYTSYATQLVMKFSGVAAVRCYYLRYATQADWNNNNAQWQTYDADHDDRNFLVGSATTIYYNSSWRRLKHFQAGVESRYAITNTQGKLVIHQTEMAYYVSTNGTWRFLPGRACQGYNSWITAIGQYPYYIGGLAYNKVWAQAKVTGGNQPPDDIYWRWIGLSTNDEQDLWLESSTQPGPKQDH